MIELNNLGNVYNEKLHSGYAGNVWAVNGLCPTLKNIGSGGGQQPMIIEVEQIGNLRESPTRNNPQPGRVYSTEGLSPALSTMQGGMRQPMIPVKDKGVTMGRWMIKKFEPMIAVSRGRNLENPSDRTAGCPTEQRLEVHDDGISNALTSVSKDNYVLEPKPIPINTEDDGTSRTIKAQYYKNSGANFVRSGDYGATGVATGYRIRKLTPKETGRLMNVSDEDIDKILSVNSNTQAYKEFGNSIVVNVLVAIFGQMFEGCEDMYKTA